ncbi:hypothetical protein D8675_21220 [Enterobacter roggenkampii]|nr:hypothetical protein D8675_21220 [Enterobacter roggenkampii]
MTVALTEQPQGWPVSIWAVFLPLSALPPERRNSKGGSPNLYTEDALRWRLSQP